MLLQDIWKLIAFLHHLANNSAVGLWFQRRNGKQFRRGKAIQSG
jgi:hypothetical protein